MQAGHGSRHADRKIAVVMEFGAVQAVSQPHRRRRPCGRLLSEVVRHGLAAGGPVHHEAAAADVAGHWMRHGERERGGDCRVNRGAPCLEDVGADA